MGLQCVGEGYTKININFRLVIGVKYLKIGFIQIGIKCD